MVDDARRSFLIKLSAKYPYWHNEKEEIAEQISKGNINARLNERVTAIKLNKFY